MREIKNQLGYSITEIIVALSIFVVVITLSSLIFQQVLIGQKKIIGGQNGQESIRYLFEVISKEIRMAKRFTNICSDTRYALTVGVNPNRVFHVDNNIGNVTGTELYFKNKDKECVKYSLDTGNFKIERIMEDGTNSANGLMLPESVKITDLKFKVVDSTDYSVQPKVTIKMDYEITTGGFVNKLTMQTTVSARYYSY
ncbi:hypothetical protein KAI92_01880 [Candidatus Parcubacteria bacterium]|nr:hypothetical protein [Candidatus Parcubacteria bacterium]